MPQSSSWKKGAASARFVEPLVTYLRNTFHATWTPITADLASHSVPAAEPGDIIVYDWEVNGSTYDHMAFVVDIASGRNPQVSEWGQLDFNIATTLWYHIFGGKSPYVKRGWTWSVMNNEPLDKEFPKMQAHLLHIPGGHM